MTTSFDQPDPNLPQQPDPNIVLLKIINQNFGARDAGEPPFKYRTFKAGGANDWYAQGQTPHITVWPAADQVGRVGIGSSKRYHHSLHKVYLWTRHPDERWQCILELQRIFQKYATNPAVGILRLDYYNEVFWQQESPIGVLFRATIDVTMIYIR